MQEMKPSRRARRARGMGLIKRAVGSSSSDDAGTQSTTKRKYVKRDLPPQVDENGNPIVKKRGRPKKDPMADSARLELTTKIKRIQ